MAPLAVDPDALSGAGAAVVSAADGVAAAAGALTSGFGANTGQDAAGEVFGLAYQDAAESVLKAAVAGINACRSTGFRVQVSASNYSQAEAASTLGGGVDILPTPTRPGEFAAPGAPWTLGPGVPAPALWVVVEAFVGDLWPNGNPVQIHAAAACWRTFGAAVSGVKDALNGPNSVIGAQQIVERELIEQQLSKLGTGMAAIGAQCDKVAKGLNDFANDVQQTQDAVRDLLHRLGSASGLWHEVVEVFEGHGLDEVKRIANDIKSVLHNLMRQAQAREQVLQQGMQMVDGLVRGLEIYVRSEITHYVGENVGNPLATAFDTFVNVGEGVFKGAVGMVEGLEQINPVRFAYDPQGAAATWKGMTKGSVINNVLNPEEAVQANEKTVKGLLHLDDWSRERPGLGAGENLFDVATLFAPGVGEVGAGTRAAADAARAAGRSADAADAAGAAGRGGRALGEVGELGRATGAMGDVSKTASGLTKDLENIRTDLPKSDPPPAGHPSALPPPKPADAPVGTAPRPVESAPPISPRPPGDQPAPVPGAAERPAVPSPSERSVPAAAAPGGHLPSPGAHLAPPPRMPITADPQPAPPTLASAHSPQSAPMSPPQPIPDSYPGGALPPEPPPPHEPGGLGGSSDGHGGSGTGGDHSGGYSTHAPAVASNLNDAFVNAHPTSDFAREVADLSTHHMPSPTNDMGNAHRVVLGKWDGQEGGYIGEARHNGGIYFDTGDATWDAIGRGLSEADAKTLGWQVNEQFLRTQMENGVPRIEYILDREKYSSLEDVAVERAGSYSAMEIEFLIKNAARYGYERVGDSWVHMKGERP